MSEGGEHTYVELSDLQRFLRQVEGSSVLPPGITLRRADLEVEEEVIAELYNAAFGYELHDRVTTSDVAGFGRHPGLAHEGIFLAFDGPLPVGLVMGRVEVPAPGGEAHRGAVELLAVRPGYRRRGLGTALMYRVYRWLAEQQVRRVGASAEDPATVSFLRRFGFLPAPPPGR